MKTHIHCGDTFRINSGPITFQILWKDQKQMWEIMNTQIPNVSVDCWTQPGTFEYEDELPEEPGESI